jgi:hypothetical protein
MDDDPAREWATIHSLARFAGCCIAAAQHGQIGAARINITSPDGLGEVALVGMDVAIWLTHVRPLMEKLGLPLAEQNPPR